MKLNCSGAKSGFRANGNTNDRGSRAMPTSTSVIMKSLVVIAAGFGLSACGRGLGSGASSVQTPANDPSIMGGTEVSETDPIAKVTAILFDTQQGAMCTASIISDEWLITAGHCVEDTRPEDLVVIFSTDFDALSKISGGIEQKKAAARKMARPVLDFVQHPDYLKTMLKLAAMDKAARKLCPATPDDLELDPGPLHSDALMQLRKWQTAQKRNQAVVAPSLADLSDSGNLNADDVAVPPPVKCGLTIDDIDAVKDWGDISLIHIAGKIPADRMAVDFLPASDKLSKRQNVVLAGYGATAGGKNGGGSGLLRQTSVTVEEPVWGSFEVLFDQTTGRGGCHGDSGGPAYIVENGKLLLFGVTSRGVHDSKDTCSQFAAYANLQNYRDWIKQVTGL